MQIGNNLQIIKQIGKTDKKENFCKNNGKNKLLQQNKKNELKKKK